MDFLRERPRFDFYSGLSFAHGPCRGLLSLWHPLSPGPPPVILPLDLLESPLLAAARWLVTVSVLISWPWEGWEGSVRSSCPSSAQVGRFPKGAVKCSVRVSFQMTQVMRPRDLPCEALLQPNNSHCENFFFFGMCLIFGVWHNKVIKS